MTALRIYDGIFSDRGSKYAVAGAPVRSKAEIDACLKELKRHKKFAKATHNSWGCTLSEQGPIKHDDGETGAGMVIIRMLEREALQDHLIIVTRWFGGTKIGGDRFRRIQDAVRYYLDETETLR